MWVEILFLVEQIGTSEGREFRGHYYNRVKFIVIQNGLVDSKFFEVCSMFLWTKGAFYRAAFDIWSWFQKDGPGRIWQSEVSDFSGCGCSLDIWSIVEGLVYVRVASLLQQWSLVITYYYKFRCYIPGLWRNQIYSIAL